MKRILLVLTVALVMAAIMAVTASAAFAQAVGPVSEQRPCDPGQHLERLDPGLEPFDPGLEPLDPGLEPFDPVSGILFCVDNPT